MNRNKSDTGKDLLIGIRPVQEAIDAGTEIDKIFIQKGLQGDNGQELLSLIRERNIPYQLVPQEKLQRMTRKNHQGVVAWAAAVAFASLEQVIDQCYQQGRDPLILMLDRITDVRNFGALCRTAECAGVDAVVIPTRHSAPVNYDALKTSAGALHHLAICREANLKNSLKFLKDSGLQLVAGTEKAQEVVYTTPLTGPMCLLMGSEEDGVSPAYLKICDALVKLPIRGKIGSLNVSVATGALLYEVLRQRHFQKTTAV